MKKIEFTSAPLILAILIIVLLFALYLFVGIPNPFVNTSRQESAPVMDDSLIKQ